MVNQACLNFNLFHNIVSAIVGLMQDSVVREVNKGPVESKPTENFKTVWHSVNLLICVFFLKE